MTTLTTTADAACVMMVSTSDRTTVHSSLVMVITFIAHEISSCLNFSASQVICTL